jgi:hypothetical protein
VHLNGFDRVMDKSERKRNRMIFMYPKAEQLSNLRSSELSFRPPLK